MSAKYCLALRAIVKTFSRCLIGWRRGINSWKPAGKDILPGHPQVFGHVVIGDPQRTTKLDGVRFPVPSDVVFGLAAVLVRDIGKIRTGSRELEEVGSRAH